MAMVAKKGVSAANVLTDVGGILYGSDAKAKLASILGLSPNAVRDILRDHGGMTAKRLLEIAERRANEATTLHGMLKVRINKKGSSK